MDANDYINGLKSGDRKVLQSLYNNNLKTVVSWIKKNLEFVEINGSIRSEKEN